MSLFKATTTTINKQQSAQKHAEKQPKKTWWNALIRHKVQLIPMIQNECRGYYMDLRIIKMMQKNCMYLFSLCVGMFAMCTSIFLSWHLEKMISLPLCRPRRRTNTECFIIQRSTHKRATHTKYHQAQWNSRYHQNTVSSIHSKQTLMQWTRKKNIKKLKWIR